MPESNPTKTCTKCQESTPLEEFYRDKRAVDGRYPACKSCHNSVVMRYYRTPEGKQTTKKAKQHQRDIGRAKYWVDKCRKSDKGHQWYRTYRLQNIEKVKARMAVGNAIRAGKLPWPKDCSCDQCGKPAEQYHHHLGYKPEHWLIVVPFCRLCHRLHHQIAYSDRIA